MIVTTQTPEERASALCDAIDDSRLAPASAADRPALVAVVTEAIREAQRAAALAMRERAAQTLEGMLPGSGRVFRPGRAWGEKAVAAVRSLEV
jgi:hypothetical protein